MSVQLRLITLEDNQAVSKLIRRVMSEFNATGAGLAYSDSELEHMFESYNTPLSNYYVLEKHQEIVGCGGFAPLLKGPKHICELKKMYFAPEIRGQGLGKELLKKILSDAKERGFTSCYIETLLSMKEANRLYEKSGFKKLEAPIGETGHFSCDTWLLREIS